MLIVFNGNQIDDFSDLANQMFALRAKLFSDRLGWKVNIQNGLEKDEFDTINPLYLCLIDDANGQLLASLRLLPTTGSHMLSDIFPETMGEADIIRDPLIWESSRFGVDTQAARSFREDGINVVTREILAGLFETAHRKGIHNIVSVFDIFVERILRRAGCIFERMGPVVSFGGIGTVAGIFDVSPTVVSQLRRHNIAGSSERQTHIATFQKMKQ